MTRRPRSPLVFTWTREYFVPQTPEEKLEAAIAYQVACQTLANLLLQSQEKEHEPRPQQVQISAS